MRSYILWGACAASLLVGAGLGAGLTIKKLEKEFSDNIEAEIEKIENHYKRYYKRGEYSDPVAMVEAKADVIVETIVTEEQYVTVEPNVFESPEPENLGEEIIVRTPNRPYILSEDEFYKNATDYEQVQLYFYAQDGVLAYTDSEMEITESDEYVGDDNLLRFGERSGDPNIVYIRNDKLKRDYEVVKIKGSYGELVHGMPYYEHVQRKKVLKKFRSDE